jgi:hypothetical protein
MSKSNTWFQLRSDHLRSLIRTRSLLTAVLFTQTAFGQEQDAGKQLTEGSSWPYVKPHILENPERWSGY